MWDPVKHILGPHKVSCRAGRGRCWLVMMVWASLLLGVWGNVATGADDKTVLRFHPSIGSVRAFLIRGHTFRYHTSQKYTGFEVALIARLAEDAGLEIEHVGPHNWRRISKLIDLEQIDLITQVQPTQENLARFSLVGVTDCVRFFVVKKCCDDKKTIDFEDDFVNGTKIFQIPERLQVNERFADLYKNDPLFSKRFVTDLGQTSPRYWSYLSSTIARVNKERLYGAIIDEYDAYILENQFHVLQGVDFERKDISVLPVTGTEPLCTYLGAGAHVPPTALEALRNAYQALRASGEFDRIWRSWYGEQKAVPENDTRFVKAMSDTANP